MTKGSHNSILSNASANVLQSILVTLLVFLLYRHITITLGIEQLGVWSVVLATLSATRLADLGLSSAVTRFVALAISKEQPTYAASIVDTVVWTLAIVISAVLPIAYLLAQIILPNIFSSYDLDAANSILPWALCSLWFSMIATAYQGALDGLQRMHYRASMMVISQLVVLLLAIWWIPIYGIKGLAWAQISQGLFLLLSGWIGVRKSLPIALTPSNWSKTILKELFSYGLSIQVSSLFLLMLDPITKILLARFGGSAIVGYFEIANQIVMRVRQVFLSANQAIIPNVAMMQNDAIRIKALYKKNMHIMLILCASIFTLSIITAYPLTWLITGETSKEMIWMIWGLSLIWAINMLSAPAYFVNLGTGKVGINALSHAIIGVVNIITGGLLGYFLGGLGVLIGYGFSIISGSLYLIYRTLKKNWIL